jgi:hypothetical protein
LRDSADGDSLPGTHPIGDDAADSTRGVDPGVEESEVWSRSVPTRRRSGSSSRRPRGARSFRHADGIGGWALGSTGCNGIRETGYEFSAGFLVLEEAVVQAVGCEPNRAEEVLLAMLWNTPDGIEVVMDSDRMQ